MSLFLFMRLIITQRSNDGRYASGGRTDFTNPPFPNYGGRPNSQRGVCILEKKKKNTNFFLYFRYLFPNVVANLVK